MELTKYQTAGNTLSAKIDNGKRMRDLLMNVNTSMPMNFMREILFNGNIVRHAGKFYLYGYSYKGTLTDFDFLNDPYFIQAVKLTNRKAFRNIK